MEPNNNKCINFIETNIYKFYYNPDIDKFYLYDKIDKKFIFLEHLEGSSSATDIIYYLTGYGSKLSYREVYYNFIDLQEELDNIIITKKENDKNNENDYIIEKFMNTFEYIDHKFESFMFNPKYVVRYLH